MNRIIGFFWGFLVFLAGLWWVTDTPVIADLVLFTQWRAMLMQISGVLAIGVMSVAMVLAARPVLAEPYFGGLDKMYRLHKWLGIAALALSMSHWLLAQGPKWLTQWGWIERTVRGPRTGPPPTAGLQQFFMDQRGNAEGIGEWAFYGAVALMVVALVKRLPYRLFQATHRWITVAFLALVWHSIVLLKFDDWSGVLGPIIGLLMLAGTVAAIWVLLGQVAVRRQVMGEVVGLRKHSALDVVEVDVALAGRWGGHAAGQFAFVTLDPHEGAHPYTISSAWAHDGRLTFIIKALGDYTRTIAQRVRVKDVVKVEGPYGQFNFDGPQRHQIWIGAGIGITPFIARMQVLAHTPDGRKVHLFHTTRTYDPHAVALLQRDAESAHIDLTVVWDARDGTLDAAQIAKLVEQWRQADIWFCGPAPFGRALKKSFKSMGLPVGRFHQELFEMR